MLVVSQWQKTNVAKPTDQRSLHESTTTHRRTHLQEMSDSFARASLVHEPERFSGHVMNLDMPSTYLGS